MPNWHASAWQVADQFFWYALAVACFVAWKAVLNRWVCDEYLVHERLALGGPPGTGTCEDGTLL